MIVGRAGSRIALVGCMLLCCAAWGQERQEKPRKVPCSLSLFPPFRSGEAAPPPIEVSLGLGVATHAAALDGATLALVGTWIDQEARGLQGSLVGNVAGGGLRGGQVALGGNLAGGPVIGIQFSGFYNGAGAGVTGAQLAAGGNAAEGAVHGLQLGGLANWAEADSWGFQGAAGLNYARADWRGLQVGGANRAGSLEGMQLGLINIGDDVAGAQIGAINIARRVRGLQLGLVNVSDEAWGAPIGLVSAVRNGQLHPELFGSDLEPANLALKFGGRRVYSTVFAGTGRDRTFLYGYGLGAHLGPEAWWVDLDLAGSSLHPYERPLPFTNVLGQLRAVVGVQLSSRLALFAGPTANCLVSLPGDGGGRPSYLPITREFRGGRVQLWPGAELGLRL